MSLLACGLWLGLSAVAVGDEPQLRIVWIDVEGGAATLIVAPSGESLLMDAGWPGERDAKRIAAAVRAEGLERIDHLVVSHFHTDHWGGVAELVRELPVARFYDRGLPRAGAAGVDERIRPELREAYAAATGGKALALKAGDRVPLAGVEVEILCANGLVAGEPPGAPQTRACSATPAHAAKPDDASDNALSLGFRLTLGEFQFLDLGDLTWNVEHKLVCPRDLVGAIDVYQATHHGHDHSNNPALLATIQPAVAVVQNGPRKGLTAPVAAWLRETPGLVDVFQLHRNLTTSAADNAPPELVANDDETCRGENVRLTLDAQGKSYTIEVPAKKTSRTDAVKGQ